MVIKQWENLPFPGSKDLEPATYSFPPKDELVACFNRRIGPMNSHVHAGTVDKVATYLGGSNIITPQDTHSVITDMTSKDLDRDTRVTTLWYLIRGVQKCKINNTEARERRKDPNTYFFPSKEVLESCLSEKTSYPTHIQLKETGVLNTLVETFADKTVPGKDLIVQVGALTDQMPQHRNSELARVVEEGLKSCANTATPEKKSKADIPTASMYVDDHLFFTIQ